MGFMNSWKALSQYLWDKWGHKIQGEADAIQAWHFSPQLQAIIDKVWTELEPAIQKALLDFIMQIYNTKGEAIAENILSGILADLHITVT